MGGSMNIIEGEFDPVMLIVTIATIIVIAATLVFVSPYINDVIVSGVCHCP